MHKLSASRTLRPWQVTALRRWRDAGYHGIAEVVTGGGKTLFALAAAEAWLSEHPTGTVCVVVPTSALQDQWVVSLADDFGVADKDICVWPEDEDLQRQFHVLVVNTARRIVPEIAEARPDVMLIADECHRYASPVNRRALVTTPAALGLSATARREHDSGYDDILVPVLGQSICQYGLDEARRDGVVAPFRLVNVEVALTADEDQAYQNLTSRLGRAVSEGDDDAIKRIAMMRATVSKRARMRIPVTAALLDGYRGVRSLVFHEDIRSADAIVTLLAARGHSAAAYHTAIGPALRRDNLRQFRRGWFDVLVSCRALDEGIDIPEAEMALIAASTSSVRQRVQRLGRVLRPAPGKDTAVIITLFATPLERGRLIEEQEHLSDVVDVAWRRAGVENASNAR